MAQTHLPQNLNHLSNGHPERSEGPPHFAFAFALAVVVVYFCLQLSLCVLAVILSGAKDPEGADITQTFKPFQQQTAVVFLNNPAKIVVKPPTALSF
jgi:hypothetical protein